jgi:hypothetical protein
MAAVASTGMSRPAPRRLDGKELGPDGCTKFRVACASSHMAAPIPRKLVYLDNSSEGLWNKRTHYIKYSSSML